MPPQKKTGGLAAKYGSKLDQAVKKHADDPTDYGMIRLPGGIKNGIARLVAAEFNTFKPGTTNAGEYYFRAAGVVVEPKSVEVDGQTVPVEGLQTSIILPVCATGQGDKHRTLEQNVGNILNEIRKLGADTTGAGMEDMEALAETLKEAGPYFRFETRTSEAVLNPDGSVKYAPRVWESWYGSKGLENYAPADDDGTVDNTGADSGGGEEAGGDEGSGDEGGGEDAGTDYTAMSLEDLAAAAENQDTAAQEEISRRGEEAGVGQETNDAQSWDEAIKVIAGATKPKVGKGGAKAGGKDKGGVTPKVGETYTYSPVDPKTKKAGKPVEVTVKDVVAKMRVCNVVDVANPKRSWGQVSFDDLHQPF